MELLNNSVQSTNRRFSYPVSFLQIVFENFSLVFI